ncbi:hypothetical protein [Thermoflavimicrobium dichotomicum]|uniref:hypothetical protein n=1 Tax=Thermoflavimicrobium dichotomicum TaxID=46223 RepID=UPI00111402CB|nr:hypothetical protein [Thermoflavimicrobium dichotomicum]
MNRTKMGLMAVVVFLVFISTSSRSLSIPTIESVNLTIETLKKRVNKFSGKDLELLKQKQGVLKLPNKWYEKEIKQFISPLNKESRESRSNNLEKMWQKDEESIKANRL